MAGKIFRSSATVQSQGKLETLTADRVPSPSQSITPDFSIELSTKLLSLGIYSLMIAMMEMCIFYICNALVVVTRMDRRRQRGERREMGCRLGGSATRGWKSKAKRGKNNLDFGSTNLNI